MYYTIFTPFLPPSLLSLSPLLLSLSSCPLSLVSPSTRSFPPSFPPLSLPPQHYNLGEVAALAGVPGGLLIGAGAGSSRVAGVNCEVSGRGHIPQ